MLSRSIYMYGTLFLLVFCGFRSYYDYLNVHLRNEITVQTRKILIPLLFIPLSLSSQNLDIQLLRAINSPQDLHIDGFFRVVSNSDIYMMGALPLTVAIVGIVNHNGDQIQNAGVIAAAVVINFGITTALKYSINRERPFITYPDIINKTGKDISDPSFPSGHTSLAFTLATSISLQYPKWYIIVPAYTYAGTVGYSRMHLGAHYPSDVLVGAIVGTGSAYLTHIINNRLTYGRRNKVQ
jgi:membrane-associated phospholipid phosphatase